MARPGLSEMSISWLLLVTAATLRFSWSRAYSDSDSDSDSDWTKCQPHCQCVIVDSRKQADCSRNGLSVIPSVLSEEIQVLLFNSNKLGVLAARVFSDGGLVNLQKIFMRSCSIREVDKRAFAGLGLLSFVDLSDNEIKRLDAALFVGETPHLRYFHANNNSIQRLEDNLFSNLDELQTVELNDNRLSAIGDRAFLNLAKLKTLKLRNNQLVRLNASIFRAAGTPARLSLELQGNPWHCDCQLRELFNLTKNSVSIPTYCDKPERLRNMSWETLDLDELACGPTVVWPKHNDRVTPDSEQVTLTCQVMGDPKPEMYWTIGGLALDNDTRLGPNGERKYTIYRSGDTTEWCNLTIWNFSSLDKGQYTCAAKNKAGIVETRVSIEIPSASNGNLGDKWVLLLCLIVGVGCALIFILFMCFVCCRRGEHFVTKKAANSTTTSNGNVTHRIIMEPEQQKTLLTAVNPVQKPPRKYDSSPQSENGGTELTELNRNLLDDNSGHAGTSLAGDSMEDRRSSNSLEPLSSCNSQDNLLAQEPPRIVARSHHPPDLLAFSSRLQQASPVDSAAANDGDYGTVSRLRRVHSPLRSPVYQPHPNPARTYSPTYETLVYGRSQSPFGGGAVTPVVAHRAGYVTIPRRARVPSWSSAPTPTLDEAAYNVEPVYDNLGPRTTADGSSVLSLPRKLAAECAAPGANPRSRPLPPTPLYASHTLPHKSKLNHVFLSIRENEQPHFHPVAREPADCGASVIKPLPLQHSSTCGQPTMATSTPDERRPSWAAAKPESGTLRRPSAADSSSSSSSSPPPPPPSRAALSSAAVKAKIAPKPPPKPKKSGPLFEDEGEDGTEV